MLQRGLWPWRARLLPTPGTWRPARLWPLPPPPQVLCVKLCGNVKYYQSHHYSTVVPPDDGNTISASTLMDILLMNDFKLVINKIAYDVQCPKREKPSNEHTAEMEHMKSLVHRLFTILHLEESQKKREHHLLEKIDHLKEQLQPLEQVKAGIEAHSEAKTSGLLWAGLALLSIQGGALAWLTWWVYSWDIMEPVTYFITFANSMVFFAYFIVTRQDYTYSAVKSRQFLQFFHKKSKQQHFDVQQYNKLKEDLAKAKESLKQARHSLYLQMQVEELNEKN
ncbi:calcium uniporter regulatory subunit MCUb, mitochondrial isoform X3 [Pan paniscus]|uniref:calcium uniporter regulatory subunit MCUb, mitochondrial isoform X3 n=1 Tax=Pan paniscus TaxID=9597 RepID=UPI0015615C87|nr:calcium uniporter regulatory subunit MCUb, mitochondrial isoform X2 [Pan paniscus]XP_054539249.1 calcium uniporter regulatory subunit MCUb, mitochondrial isoform X5 [Pan troglodytes]